MKALITGGAGFIGSHLAEFLLGRGHEVHVLDDLSTGSMENIDSLRGSPRFHYHVESVLAEPVLAELVDRADVIYHLAAAVGVRLIVDSPVRTLHTNIATTEIVLRHAAKKKKTVLVTSSSEVYGKSTKAPFREDDDMVLGPTTKSRWSYACSKAVDEFLALAYWKEQHVPTVIVRLFNTVGPRQTGRYGMVIPRFVGQALQGGPITVYGDGSQTRCFAHVSDVVEQIWKLAEHPDAIGQVFNIGSDDEISIGKLAERVQNLVNPSASISFIPYAKAYQEGFEDIERRVPDLTKLRKLTGYAPKFSLDDILRSVRDHLKDNKKESS